MSALCINDLTGDELEFLKGKLLLNCKPEGGCLLWTRSVGGPGYGQIVHRKTLFTTHRLAWRIFRGRIPVGKQVCHHCDNTRCILPGHLFLGTAQDNADDKMRKGRHRHGHLYGDAHPARTRPEIIKRGEQHGMARLTYEIADAIRAAVATGEKKADVARRFDVNRGTVSMIIANQQWVRR